MLPLVIKKNLLFDVFSQLNYHIYSYNPGILRIFPKKIPGWTQEIFYLRQGNFWYLFFIGHTTIEQFKLFLEAKYTGNIKLFAEEFNKAI